MGFGGAAAAMIVSLKNNQRKKQHYAFNRVAHSSKDTSKIHSKPLTKEALTTIKTKIQTENKALFKKHLIIFSCIFIPILMTTITLIFY